MGIQLKSDSEILHYIATENPADMDVLFNEACLVRRQYYGNDVYFRGLIEFTNYCRNNCYYCGIRLGNDKIMRYRLDLEEILTCCRIGADLGFQTFVLQGGEDSYFTDEKMIEMITEIHRRFPQQAITLSIGEKTKESYEAFYKAGAVRYLLRHESADRTHYDQLHPQNMNFANRKQCLLDLKSIGYQVGAGFMVGSPFQTPENLLADLRFLQYLKPQMVGIGPFISQKDTPFGMYSCGSVEMTLRLIALVRLLLPEALIPATTALASISSEGCEKALLVGANVVMPNLSPIHVRKQYALYDNKAYTENEAAENLLSLKQKIQKIGFVPNMARGDYNKKRVSQND